MASLRDAGDVLFRRLALVFFDEVVHQERNVLLPLPERRQLDGDDVQPVVEVFPEGLVGDRLSSGPCSWPRSTRTFTLRVCGLADARKLPFLQNAQQLHLEGRGQLADLVQEQRALVRLLHQTLFVGDGAR